MIRLCFLSLIVFGEWDTKPRNQVPRGPCKILARLVDCLIIVILKELIVFKHVTIRTGRKKQADSAPSSCTSPASHENKATASRRKRRLQRCTVSLYHSECTTSVTERFMLAMLGNAHVRADILPCFDFIHHVFISI